MARGHAVYSDPLPRVWREMTLSPQHSMDRRDKVFARSELQHVTQRADDQSFLHQFWLMVYGHKYDSCSRIIPENLGRSRDAVKARHGNVGDDDIETDRFGCGDKRVAVSDSGHHVKLRFHERSDVFNNFRMII